MRLRMSSVWFVFANSVLLGFVFAFALPSRHSSSIHRLCSNINKSRTLGQAGRLAGCSLRFTSVQSSAVQSWPPIQPLACCTSHSAFPFSRRPLLLELLAAVLLTCFHVASNANRTDFCMAAATATAAGGVDSRNRQPRRPSLFLQNSFA